MKKIQRILYLSIYLLYAVTTISIVITGINQGMKDPNFYTVISNYIVLFIIMGVFIVFDYMIKYNNVYFTVGYITFALMLPFLFILNNLVISIVFLSLFLIFIFIKLLQTTRKDNYVIHINQITSVNKLYLALIGSMMFILLSESNLLISAILALIIIVSIDSILYIKLRKSNKNYDFIYIINLFAHLLLFSISYHGSIDINNKTLSIVHNIILPLTSVFIALAMIYYNKLRVKQLIKEISID